MRIYPSESIREWDAYTIQKEGISSFQLMQRAAYSCFLWIKSHVNKSRHIAVYCGPGNNGGDGLLIGAYLHQFGYHVQVFADQEKCEHERGEALAYCRSLELQIQPLSVAKTAADVIIDALFGHGLKQAIGGPYLDLVHRINRSDAIRISIDIPSGMPSEARDEVFTEFIKADWVLTFQQPKQSFFLDEYGASIGQWIVLNIGLSSDYQPQSGPYLIDKALISGLIRKKPRFSHKGNFGSTLLVGGADQYPGAICLAAMACLLSGVGKTFVYSSPRATAACLHLAPEAIFLGNNDFRNPGKSMEQQDFNCIGVGPGLGQEDGIAESLLRPLFKKKSRWVIDADALNLISAGRAAFPEGETVITPHPGEFDRLTRVHHTTSERWKTAEAWSRKHNKVLVLKGAYTSLFFPDGRQFINSSGNSGLAKGGSGDVLCGWIAGYIGRGYSVEEAALIAVYLHGLAADLAISEISKDALKASDIVNYGRGLLNIWEI